jgi:hypothetical protein
MLIQLKRLKVAELKRLTMAYNKLMNIPHPSQLRKQELIDYLHQKLDLNEKGFVKIEHPKLKQSISEALRRMEQENKKSKDEYNKLVKEIEDDIKRNKKDVKPFIPYRDTLSKSEREEQDKDFKYYFETGKIALKNLEIPKTKKEIKELEAREKAVKKLLEQEAKEKAEARSKYNQEAMKRGKPKKPTKKPEKKPEKKPVEEDDDDEELTPEQKKMQAYFASIKDPIQRMKEVKEYMIKQRENIRKKVEAKEKKM